MTNTSKHIFLGFAVLLFFLISCDRNKNTITEDEHTSDKIHQIELTHAQFIMAGIETDNIEMRTISRTIPASGMLDVPPQSKVSISAPMGGFVRSTNLLQGTRVEKGEIVAVMQDQEYIRLQQEYLEKFHQLEFLKSEYERQQELTNENINARKSFEQAKANYYATKAIVDGDRVKLQMLNINMSQLEKGEIQSTINLYSPISGYVTKVHTNIGAYVNPTDVLFEIVNTEELHAELTIFEKDVPILKVNQRVWFTLANESSSREAYVALIGREISDDRSVQVHCEIEKQDRELIPGMYLKAIVETDSLHVMAVPEESIISFEGKNYVFMEESDALSDASIQPKDTTHHRFRMAEVNVGETEFGFISIAFPGDEDKSGRIVTKGAFSLLAVLKNSAPAEGHAH